MKKLVTALFATIAIASSGSVFAGTSEITWTNPEKYTDMRPANETKKGFQQRTFRNLEKHVTKLASDLPEGYTLKMDVTDVNLAGEVQMRSTQMIRVVDRVFIPSMKFSYQLVDASGAVVKEEAEVKLKDMNFMDSSAANRYRSQSFSYEKVMLDKWFNAAFSDYKS
ncbi:DUF3016 domain-containing protein [Thalassotalea eurytherma]|uniref:DUF3016 domain-containing protein n=1 Tax=Thalassotalea eurytherma TaxID=1144278 RepID=A0ABQ6H403_9GAMM|nr:DUF3016 domain-containing protein [Thalassotalea eurytherma]GLX82898.1 hypothetical protein theurythT_23500 [Thalassotalea eurytherma]